MKYNLFSYPYSWVWFFAGMCTFGLPAEFVFGSSRSFWGALGGVLFVVIGGAVHKLRRRRSADSDE